MGGNFLGGSLPSGNFPGGVWWVGIFLVGNFPGGIFLEPNKRKVNKFKLIDKFKSIYQNICPN